MGLFRRLFGAKKDHAEPTADQTVRVNRPAATGEHVGTLDSLKTSNARKMPEPEGDAGPWYIGKTVADIFEIRGVLGRGGMGIVYLAHDNATLRKVAVKVPLGKFVDDEGARKRFTREAEAWAGLIHPHIVHAFDVRDEQSTDYRPAIFMDYCDGGSLADRISNGTRLPMTEALDIAVQVCWAMAFAHEKGHIHRDLKPANVLLTSEGKALVTDFGLVKSLTLQDLGPDSGKISGADAKALASISQAGGTPEYMPPEQWEGKAEKASDIYAFGVMLYELFCGCRPFTAEKRLALRVPHMRADPPDPKEFNGHIPNDLAMLMLLCLKKQPSGRPVNFDDVADRLIKVYSAVVGQERQPVEYSRSRPGAYEISRTDKERSAWNLVRLGSGCMTRSDHEDADRAFAGALSVFDELHHVQACGICYANMGIIAGDLGRYDQASSLLAEALSIAEKVGEPHGLQACYTNMGILAKKQGKFEEAIALHQKALAAAQQVNDREAMAQCYANMGSTALDAEAYEQNLEMVEKANGFSDSRVGEKAYKEAEKMLLRSCKIYEELDHEPGMSTCYQNLGVIAARLRESDKAMKMLHKSLAIKERLGNSAGIARCYHNMGLVAMNGGDFERAMRFYSRAMELFVKIEDRAGERSCCAGLSDVSVNQGDIERALHYTERDLALCLELSNKYMTAGAYRNLAGLCELAGKDSEVRSYARKAVALYEELEMPVAAGLRQAAGFKVSVDGYDHPFETSHKRAPVFTPKDMATELPRLNNHRIGVACQHGTDGPETAARLLKETFEKFGAVVTNRLDGMEVFAWIQAGSGELRYAFVVFDPEDPQHHLCSECGPRELTATIMTGVCNFFGQRDKEAKPSCLSEGMSQLLLQLDLKEGEEQEKIEKELVSMGRHASKPILASIMEINQGITRAAIAGNADEAGLGMRAMTRRISVLGRIADPAAIPVLLDALGDSAMVADNPVFPEAKHVLRASCDALVGMGTDVIPHLQQHKDDRRKPVRRAVASVLKRLCG